MAEAIRSNKQRSKELGLTGFLLKPLALTLKQTLKSTIHKPTTVLYPWEKLVLPDVYRGRPGLRFDKCIGCGVCMRICPNRCIDMMEVDDLPKEGVEAPVKKVKRPRVNVGRCMMCGYCAEYCPTDAMIVTPEYELASFTRGALIYDPYQLQYDGVPGNEVHILEVLPAELHTGAAPRPALENKDLPSLEDSKCIGCTKCAKACPVEAVEMKEMGVNEKGRPIKRPVFDNDKCVSCENCVEVCPKNALCMKEVQ